MAHAGLWLLAGVLLGSVTGAATATFLAPAQQAPTKESTAEFAGRVAASIEQAVTRAVERVREEAAAARPAAAAAEPDAAAPRTNADPAPAARRRAAPHEPAPETAEPDAAAMVRDASSPAMQRNDARVSQLLVRTSAARDARWREWMFVGERGLASSLGVPDEVTSEKDGTEVWHYQVAYVGDDGEQASKCVEFKIARSRVIGIDGGEEIPDDR